MKKKLKKILSRLFPKGDFKERLKLKYYSILKPTATTFELLKSDHGALVYKTNYKKHTLLTNQALYSIAPDFQYYQHFYSVKKDDVVIDAGANCGHLSLLFSKCVGENGMVYAFEPDRFNIDHLQNNIDLDKTLSNNIRIQDLLLWNENSLVDFYEGGTVASSAIYIPDSKHIVKKEAIKIDDWVLRHNLQKLDFIKMDIEGAEIEALEGCTQTIQTFQPNFAIASYHYVNGEQTYLKLEEFFRAIDYPFKTVRFRKNEIITFAGPSIKQ